MNIVGLRKIWFSLSATFVGLSIAALALWGLPLGIDFTGGSLLEVSFIENVPSKEVVQQLVLQSNVDTAARVQETGEETFIVRMKSLSEDEHQEVLAALNSNGYSIEERRFDSIGPVIGKELQTKALNAMVLVLIAIVLFVAYAFRLVSEPVKSWKYGIIALIALFHDVLITAGVFAVLGQFFGYEIGLPFVAAILTILGYSVNDTIVVFDRIRENLKTMGSATNFEQLVSESIKQTITRSINTSVTTLLVLFAIYLFGGTSISTFILALIIGIGAGTYSSIFLASPLLLLFTTKDV
jgi:preprotein translocase subunit SecF